MANFAVVKSSELENRLDADFYIAKQSVAGRLAELEANMTVDHAKSMLRQIPTRFKQALLPLCRGQLISGRALTYDQIQRIEKEYSHLSLALLEKEIGTIESEIEGDITRKEAELAGIRALAGNLSKNTAPTTDMNFFQAGFVYPLRDPEKYNDTFGTGYSFAVIPHDVEPGACYICDAWIVNLEGEFHPGIDAVPVPVSRDDVDLAAGRPFIGETPVPKSLFDSPFLKR